MLKMRTRSLRLKLLLVVLASTFTALVVMSTVMVIYDARTYEKVRINDLTAQADILGRASAAAIAFDDTKAAHETLSSLQVRNTITAAAIYTAKGALFATYLSNGMAPAQLPSIPESDGYRIEGDRIVLFKRIIDRNEILGTMYLQGRYELGQRLRDYLAILGLVLVASLIAAVLLSTWMHSVVVKPMTAIAAVARQVMEKRDFSLRASKTTRDEIGYLVDAFNDMLAEIGKQAATLQASYQTLEHEMEERRSTEHALHLTQRRNQTLVTAVSAVVWGADASGRFTEGQLSWSEYTGQKPEDSQGLGWRHAFHPDDQPALDLAWARSINGSSTFELEFRLWHAASARHRHVSVRGVPVIEPDGAITEWIGTLTDIDDQRTAEDELHTLNAELERRVTERTAELEAANKELEGFSYSVSHDLRAPLRAISGFARLLQQDHAAQFDEEGQRKIGIVLNEAHRMGVLIDDLLAFSRLGRQAIRPTELDMMRLAQGTFERLHVHHQGPAPDFRLGSLPRGAGDRVLIEQVWANFLSNALKFTAKVEQPIIEVGAISDAAEHIYFVRDNGAGFDPRYQAKLFGVFQRLHDTAQYPGNGVGLALVQRIVTRHRGRVWAEGKPGAGATFYFTLPREPTDG